MILVDVYIPAVDDSYDFRLDEDVAVENIIAEISEITVRKMKSSETGQRTDFALYSLEQKRALEKNRSLYSNGIRDGSRLMLL